jgi:hypothetical protein
MTWKKFKIKLKFLIFIYSKTTTKVLVKLELIKIFILVFFPNQNIKTNVLFSILNLEN